MACAFSEIIFYHTHKIKLRFVSNLSAAKLQNFETKLDNAKDNVRKEEIDHQKILLVQ